MIWDYLATFWDRIVGVGEYTVAFFQSIGNAVAGAVGSFFDATVHLIADIGTLFSWLFSQLKTIFLGLLTPFNYVFVLLKNIILRAFTTSPSAVVTEFSNPVLEIFQAIPLWSVVGTILGGMILLFLAFSVIRSISSSL
jgi:hypothetical protein